VFTGIVEELGTVRSLDGARLDVGCSVVAADSDIGASLAVNGVCLTVVHRFEDGLGFDLSPETIARTSLRRLEAGHPVNLERPVTPATRLGGHLVQGHVDGVGTIAAVERDGEGASSVRVQLPDHLLRYIVEKGSVAIDGISLTVAGTDPGGLTSAVIPHTLAVTTLGSASPGDPVNVEVDVIAKYVERLMEGQPT
jgi:riboflavin synthase